MTHRIMFYNLGPDGEPVPMEPAPGDPPGVALAWSGNWDNPARRVAYDEVGDVEVSTVFVGLDYAFVGPPLVFETAVFGPDGVEVTGRYSTRAQALAGHKAAVAGVLEARR